MSDGPPTVAVGAIVVDDGALLMVKRGHEPAKGLWSVPGGRLERGEYMTAAVKREVKEETGLDIEVGGLVGFLEVLGDQHYVILDFAARVDGERTPNAGADAAEARWIPLEQIEELECTPRFVETLKSWGVLPA
ncbi:MAG TPA: NUDIX hydrolase [Actinomycetota bacterium]|nr:NUDIX hydrolase [Actinomycetota bacterium]